MKNGLLRSFLRLFKRLIIHNLCYVVTIRLKALTLCQENREKKGRVKSTRRKSRKENSGLDKN